MWVLWAERLLTDRQRPAHQRRRILEQTFVSAEDRQVVEAGGGLGMGRAKGLLVDGEGVLDERARRRVAPKRMEMPPGMTERSRFSQLIVPCPSHVDRRCRQGISFLVLYSAVEATT